MYPHTSFKVICLCVKSFHNNVRITKGHIYLRISEKWCCIKWKNANFSGSIPVRRILRSKPLKFVQTSFAHDNSSLATYCRWQLRPTFIQSRMVSSESHNIRTSGVSSGNRALTWVGYSWSFKVILNGVSRNPEQVVVVTYNNVDLISDTYEDIATRKLQIRRFQRIQPTHFRLTTVLWETL